jgi:transcription elongation GreA/GreB family factor
MQIILISFLNRLPVKPLSEALQLTNQAVTKALDGLPAHKLHCSVLAEQAVKAAIAEAKIIDASKLRSDIVQILSTVEMKNVKNGMVMKYTIVSESEANLREGKISSTTPIAQGLLGKKVGDVVEVKIPQGTIQLEILNISVGN